MMEFANQEEAREYESCLLSRVQGGDVEAYGQVYELHRDRLLRFLGWKFGNDKAEDLVQDAFAKGFDALKNDHFTDRGQGMYGWLFRVAVNKAINGHRRDERKRMIPTDFQAGDHYFAAPGDFTEDLVGTDFVDNMLSGLSPEKANIVRAVDVSGGSYREYAEDNDLAVGTVGSRLHRARHDLRQQLEGQEPSSSD